MQLFSLLLSGAPIEDVFIYRTSMYCWTFENRLRIYTIGDVEAAVAAADPERSALVNYVLFHSRGLGASPDQLLAWYAQGTSDERYAPDDPPLVVDIGALPCADMGVHLESDALLDMLIYYDRLYLATNGGLYSIAPFDASEPPVGSLNTDRKVADACYSASAGLGTIAASCGRNGLRLILDDFRWSASSRRARKASDESIRAEIGSGSVVNHRSHFDYEFLAATVEETQKGPVLIGTRKTKMSQSHQIDHQLSDEGQNIEFTLWDQSRLVVFERGVALSVSVMASGGQRQLNRIRQVGAYQNLIGRVISAARVGRQFAVESDESVAFVSADDARRIDTGPIVSLRTYPNSRRYRRLATATSAKGIWLIGSAE